MAWDTNEEYYSGQGSVLVGYRDKDGKPKGLRHIGNVSALSIATAVSYNEHKESKTGNRSTDRRNVSETNVTFSAACENFSSENLKMFLRAELVKVQTGTVTDLPINAVAGLITPLEHLKLSNVVVKNGATTLAAYVDDNTPYDYEVNADAGSLRFNKNSENLGVVVSDIVVGATTTIAATFAGLEVGDVITLGGVAGADAASINGKELTVTAVNSANFVVAFDSTGKDLTATSAKAYGGAVPVTASYSYEAHDRLEAMTAAEEDVFIRFEGLNTAESNAPVVIDIFRVNVSPLQELALISDEIQSSNLEGPVLVDTTRKTGSKYYTVRKV